MNNELLDFTRRALQQGASRPQITSVLKQAGWVDADVNAALNSFADVTFVVPVPRPRPYLSAREVFVYLVMFTSLYVSAWHLGSLLFDFINRALPDSLDNNYYRSMFYDGIRGSIAALVISFPLFLICFRSTTRAIEKDPTRRNSWPRKWLTYLTMFVAVTSLAADLGTLVYNVLGGELSLRFLLKVIVVGVIAGGTFCYFLRDMRQDEKE